MSATQETITIINCLLNAPLILISVTGNSLVLVAILKTPSIRSPSMIMISSLAVSDLLVGILAQPLFVAKEIKSLTNVTTEDPLLKQLTAVTGFFVCGVSLGTTMVICLDRFMALHYHLRYSSIVTESRVMYTVGIIWLIIFLCSGIYFWNAPFYHLISGLFTGMCLIICTAFYIGIYGIVRKHQLQIHVQQQAVESSNNGNNIMLRLKKSASNTFLFYIFMIICYLPNLIIMTMFGTVYKEWKTEWDFATTVVFKNSSINPIWRLRELRTAIVKIAKRLLNKQADEDIGTSTHNG